jgi:hypothetical protein
MCEDPAQELMARLFIGPPRGGLFEPAARFLKVTIASAVLALRLGIADGVREGSREEAWRVMRWIAARFSRNGGFMFPQAAGGSGDGAGGARFSAADLAVAALVEPLSFVPEFRDEPAMAAVFVRTTEILRLVGAKTEAPYAELVRTRREELAHPPLASALWVLCLRLAGLPVRLLRGVITTVRPERRVSGALRRNECIPKDRPTVPDSDQRKVEFFRKLPKAWFQIPGAIIGKLWGFASAMYDYEIRVPQIWPNL